MLVGADECGLASVRMCGGETFGLTLRGDGGVRVRGDVGAAGSGVPESAARLARETSAILFENSSCRDAHALCRVSCDPTHASCTSLTSAVSEAHCCIAVTTASSALSARVVAADSICDCAAWASLSS